MGRGSRPGRAARDGRLRRDGVLAVLAAVAVLVADAGTKAWASRRVGTTGGFLQLRHLTNAGATLGLGSQHPAVVLVLSLVATAGVVVWWVTGLDAVERLALAVVLGGAAGNLLDRVLNGAVTDWLHVACYSPTFNLADVAIRLGALVALVARGRSMSRTANSGMRRRSAGQTEAMPVRPGFESAPRARRTLSRTWRS